MRPEKPLKRKSISGGERREMQRKILKEDAARRSRIKRESSDGCNIDDSTVGDGGEGEGSKRLRPREARGGAVEVIRPGRETRGQHMGE